MRGGGEGRVLSAKTFCDGAAGKKTDAVRKSARQKARDAPSAEKKTLRAAGLFFGEKDAEHARRQRSRVKNRAFGEKRRKGTEAPAPFSVKP